MLDTVGPLPVRKAGSRLQNLDGASGIPACSHHPCASWRKALRKGWHTSPSIVSHAVVLDIRHWL